MSGGSFHLELRDQRDVVEARGRARRFAKQLGMGIADQTRLATAISEVARNAIMYGGGGTCEVVDRSTPTAHRVTVVILDHGPGIEDLEAAMRDGYSSGGSLGAGLPGVRRIVTELDIVTSGSGTRVTFTLESRRRGRPDDAAWR